MIGQGLHTAASSRLKGPFGGLEGSSKKQMEKKNLVSRDKGSKGGRKLLIEYSIAIQSSLESKLRADRCSRKPNNNLNLMMENRTEDR